MSNRKIRILILEDRASDAELVQFCLMEAGFIFTAKWAVNEKEYVRELEAFHPDLILSDYDLPQYTGALALAEARRRFPHVPFILVTGALSDAGDLISKMMAGGANDYVMKDRLERLPSAIRKAFKTKSAC